MKAVSSRLLLVFLMTEMAPSITHDATVYPVIMVTHVRWIESRMGQDVKCGYIMGINDPFSSMIRLRLMMIGIRIRF